MQSTSFAIGRFLLVLLPVFFPPIYVPRMAAPSLASVELSMASGFVSSKSSSIGQLYSNSLPSFHLKPRKYAGGHFKKQIPSTQFVVHADYGDRRGSGAGDFVAGFVLGGLVFGAIGYLFAPQVSSKLFGTKDGELETSSISDDDEGIAKTRRNLNEKIAKLNAAIDNVSAQLRADNGFSYAEDNVTELESAA